MGYLVEVSGAVVLPVEREVAAAEALQAAMVAVAGWLGAEAQPLSVAELAEFAGAAVERVGERLVFAPDEDGDPKWSDQAQAFFVGLAPWVVSGRIDVLGEDLESWTYDYSGGSVIEQRRAPVDDEDDSAGDEDRGRNVVAPSPVRPSPRRWSLFRRAR